MRTPRSSVFGAGTKSDHGSRMVCMRVAAGKVVNGHVEVAGVSLPEGADVIVGIPEDADAGFELNAQEEELLATAAAEADRGDFANTETILAAIRRRRLPA